MKVKVEVGVKVKVQGVEVCVKGYALSTNERSTTFCLATLSINHQQTRKNPHQLTYLESFPSTHDGSTWSPGRRW